MLHLLFFFSFEEGLCVDIVVYMKHVDRRHNIESESKLVHAKHLIEFIGGAEEDLVIKSRQLIFPGDEVWLISNLFVLRQRRGVHEMLIK